jgi:UDP-glucose:(heptosyl)LPS alpha-1,3-glucosyltransferase
MKKKIAIIIERADISLGGAERSVLELAGALSENDLEVDILTAKGQANAENVHILCSNVPGKRVCYFAFKKILKRYLAVNHYDIVHSVLPFDFADVYQPRGGSLPESILRNAASYQNRFVKSYKKISACANLRRTQLLLAEKKLCHNAAGPMIVALSKYVARQFKQHYGVDDERIVVIPNGVKIDLPVEINEADKLRKQILAEFNIPEAESPVLFLFVANNFRLKGLSCLIRAMRLAEDYGTGRQACLVIVGKGRFHRYYRLAKNINILNKISFLGPVPQIQNLLAVIDVAVLPTFYDPSSRYILEAIASGRPVITTRHNGAVDLFDDNRHGKVVECAEDITALAQAISYFSNTDNIQKASDNIIADGLREKVSIKRVAKDLKTVYNSIMEKHRQK